MKTIKITEQAHTNLMKLQLTFYEMTGKKYTFSQIIEKFYIEAEFKNEEK